MAIISHLQQPFPDRSEFLLLAILMLAGCGGGSAGSGIVLPSGGQPSTGPGSVQEFHLDTGTLGPATLDAATYNVPGLLTPSVIAFRRVDAASSLQGTAVTSLGAQADEVPHVATVGTFLLACCELTQGQWSALATRAGRSGSDLAPWLDVSPASEVGGTTTSADLPAFGLSYDLLVATLAAYNAAAASGAPTLRLPSEDEWEHACRASSLTRYSWGEAEDLATVSRYALVRETRTRMGAELVARRQANAFGFYDMAGNVWEWVESGVTADPILRGGSWSDNLLSARAANRQRLDRAIPYGLAGVRLVLVMP